MWDHIDAWVADSSTVDVEVRLAGCELTRPDILVAMAGAWVAYRRSARATSVHSWGARCDIAAPGLL